VAACSVLKGVWHKVILWTLINVKPAECNVYDDHAPTEHSNSPHYTAEQSSSDIGTTVVFPTRTTRVVPKVSDLKKKHNTTTMPSLFFHIISANFTALDPLFLQLLYTSLVEEFILPLKKDLHRRNDIIIT